MRPHEPMSPVPRLKVFNIGDVMGLKGIAQVIPLLIVLAGIVGIITRWCYRPVEHSADDNELLSQQEAEETI